MGIVITSIVFPGRKEVLSACYDFFADVTVRISYACVISQSSSNSPYIIQEEISESLICSCLALV